jgi:hypothetical protein
MSHTPGPWSLKDGFVLAVGPVNDPEGKAVTHIVDNPLEAFDNARLIAAAPELLDACQKFVGHIASLNSDTEKCRHLRMALNCHAGDLIHAAIAKATGEVN